MVKKLYFLNECTQIIKMNVCVIYAQIITEIVIQINNYCLLHRYIYRRTESQCGLVYSDF
ncbi:unnamed protein product [Spodoptera exigua]|nr:unnamed protein product [Spodoptera exigua]